MKECDLCHKQVDKCDLIQVQELFTEFSLGYVCLICLDKIIYFRNLFPDEFNIIIRTHRFNYFKILKDAVRLIGNAKTQ